MAEEWTPTFVKVQATGPQSKILGWEVTFALEAEHTRSEVKTLVSYGCPPQDVVKIAMHQLHQRFEELVLQTASWRLQEEKQPNDPKLEAPLAPT